MGNGSGKQSSVLTALLLLLSLTSLVEARSIQVPGEQKTIQGAINIAEPGDQILVSSGIYRERLVLRPGVTLKSAGDDDQGKIGLRRAEETIIDGGGKRGVGPGVTMAESSTLDGFTVTNVGDFNEKLWKRHHATQGNEQSHEHIGKPGTAGISVVGISECTVANNITHHIGYTGIVIIGSEDKRVSPKIIGNVSYRNMGGGIGSMKKSTAIISENICFENFYAGIGHNDASPLVTNNICYGNIRSGIGVSEGACPVVQGNRCYMNRRAGIGIRTGAETRPVIEDNDCYRNDMAGIGIEEKAEPTIRNNRCYENKLAGIGSRDRARPKIIGNQCYRNQGVGIGSEGGAEAFIQGNECFANILSGIGQRGDAHTTLIDNYCHHNKASGIGFDDCTACRSTVSNNRVIDNDLLAVGIHAGWTVQLSGNELSRRGGLPPIIAVFKGATATFTDNTIRGEGVAGIRVSGTITARGNRFEGGALRTWGPPNFAVWALQGASVTLSQNQISSWRHALHASAAAVSADHNTVRNFHQTAFVVKDAPLPADVYENIAISKNPQDRVLTILGATGNVRNNELRLINTP